MMRVHVFIACAGDAVRLGEALQVRLQEMTETVKKRKHGEAPPVLWEVVAWWQKSRGLGKTLINTLRDECARADLAVTLLTEDDLTLRRGVKVLAPRDNCIFEAGLFMGALGMEGNRSVLISSVDKEALPTDLDGVKYIRIPKLTRYQLRNKALCLRAMTEPARVLAHHAWNELREPTKRPALPVLSADELFEREKPIQEGGDLQTGTAHAVVVNTLQPAEEQNILRARRVVENMYAGVKYLYFFRADTVHVPKVISLLQSLVISALTRKPSATEQERQKIIRDNASEVPRTLREIQKRLYIFFLPNDRAPLLFCVHNAWDMKYARCYLRDGAREQFYLWGIERTAFDVAADLSRFQNRQGDPAVFYPSALFDLYAAEGASLRKALEGGLRASFGDSAEIQKLCFLDEETVKALEAPSPSSLGGAVPSSQFS